MNPAAVRDVSVTIDGVTHQGTYYVQNKIVYVQSEKGNKATQLGGSSPQTMAMLLLSELVRS